MYVLEKNYLYFFCVALVSFGKVTPEQKQEVEKFGVAMYSWDEFLQVVGYSFDMLLLFVVLAVKSTMSLTSIFCISFFILIYNY